MVDGRTAQDDAVPSRVLIADDDRAIRESLARALELEGYEVVAVVDGVESLTRIHRETFDALVLDDDQAYHLCRGHDRATGLEDSRTFRDVAAIVFAEELLPGCRAEEFGPGEEERRRWRRWLVV